MAWPPYWSFENINQIKSLPCSKRKEKKNQMASYFVWEKNQTLSCGLWGSHSLALPTSLRAGSAGNLQDLFLFPNTPDSWIAPRLLRLIFLPGTLFPRRSEACFHAPFASQLKCHRLRKAFPYHVLKSLSPFLRPSVTLACLIILIEFITVTKVYRLLSQSKKNSPFKL